MRDLLDQKLARFEQLEKDQVDPEVLSKPARITAVMREHGSLAKLAKKYRRFKQICTQIDETQQMIDGDGLGDARAWPRRKCHSYATSARRCGTSSWR